MNTAVDGEVPGVSAGNFFRHLPPAEPYGVPVPRDYEGRIREIMSGEHTLRGVMALISNAGHETAIEDLRRLRHEFGANHVRLFFEHGTGMLPDEYQAMIRLLETLGDLKEKGVEIPGSEERPLMTYEATLRLFEKRWAPLFQELDLPVIVTLAWGDLFHDAGSQVWSDPAVQERVIDAIVEQARMWSELDIVIGYDLINEPIPPGSRPRLKQGWFWDWTAEEAREDLPDGDKVLARIYNEAIRRIRAFDQKRLIVLEPGPWGTPSAFPGLLDVTDDPRLVFSFHCYTPHAFACVGNENWGDPETGPPVIDPEHHVYPNADMNWGRDVIAGMFDFVREFQREREARTGRPCPVWVGEFGATRFTDSTSQRRWFTDVLGLMEEYGFGYAWFVYGAGATPRWEHFNQYGP